MNLHQLLEITSRANDLQKEDLSELIKYQKAFPYFQWPLVLLAKFEFDRSKGRDKDFLAFAAIASENRFRLKELVENEAPWLRFNQTFEKQLLHAVSSQSFTKEENFIDDLDEQLIPRPKTEVDPVQKLNVLKKLGQELHEKKALEDKASEPKPIAEPAIDVTNENKASTSPTNAPRKRRKAASDDLIENIKKREKKEIKDEKKKEQIDIIKAFSKKAIKLATIQEIEANHNQSDLSEQSTKINDTFVTEAYAKLLAKQNKKSKAIEIYQKLIVKFPDKSTYFADQIKNLEE